MQILRHARVEIGRQGRVGEDDDSDGYVALHDVVMHALFQRAGLVVCIVPRAQSGDAGDVREFGPSGCRRGGPGSRGSRGGRGGGGHGGGGGGTFPTHIVVAQGATVHG
eukprot:scaffold42364_cov69-Phaeocystis_antarctica.AAC.2